MVLFVVGMLYTGFIVAAMITTVVLVAKQIIKYFKKK